MRKRKSEDISLPLATILPKHKIQFIHGKATTLDPIKQEITLQNDKVVNYDYLIIATGPRLGFESIPGLGPENGYTHSICTTPHAEETAKAVDRLERDPGPIVIGATQGASCFGPAYEFALLLEHELKARGGEELIKKCPITFVTPEPFIGHLGLKGVKGSKEMLTKLFHERGIEAFINCEVISAGPDSVSIEHHTDPEQPTITTKKTLPSKFTMLIPPFKGMEVWSKVPGLTNEKGLILIDQHQQSIAFSNIFGVGTCVYMPPIEKTLVPTGSPKTGYMIESMGTATVKNIRDMIDQERHGYAPKPKHHPLLNGLCITDFGDQGAIFLTIPQIEPRTMDYAINGKIGLLAKIAFEKYFLHKVETGDTDPYYEKYMLQLIGVKREVKEV